MHPKRLPVLLSLMLYPASLLAQSTLTQVDPLVGTQNGGNTTPGAQVPFGFVSFGPDMTSDSGFTSGYDPAATLHLGNGKSFVIVAEGTTEAAKYVQAAELNGLPLHRAWLTHNELISGGQLRLHMGSTPKAWDTEPPPDWSKRL